MSYGPSSYSTVHYGRVHYSALQWGHPVHATGWGVGRRRIRKVSCTNGAAAAAASLSRRLQAWGFLGRRAWVPRHLTFRSLPLEGMRYAKAWPPMSVNVQALDASREIRAGPVWCLLTHKTSDSSVPGALARNNAPDSCSATATGASPSVSYARRARQSTPHRSQSPAGSVSHST